MTLVQLRKSGPFVEPFKEDFRKPEDPPRALRTLAHIIDNDLCHRCGSCVGICPTDVLAVDDEEYPVVKNLGACTDCDLCVKVCPGDEFDAVSVAKQMFGEFPDPKDMHGHFKAAYLAYATDPQVRERSTSGGLVTALLLSLLRRGIIDGAVVIGSHETELWKGVPIIARTEDAIREATKAKYAISPTNVVFKEIREIPGSYAVVGLPCQIHGFHNAARLDKRLKERVKVTIGLFCHAAIEHEPMKKIWADTGQHGQAASKFISRYGKHSGTPHLEFPDGSVRPVYFPNAKSFRPSSMEIINVLYRLYTPPRCLTCYDATSEFADIAVGDPWMPRPSDKINFFDGYTFTFARTECGDKLLQDASEAGDLELIGLRRKTAKTANIAMGVEKRHRAFRLIETRRRQGYAVPFYNFKIPRATGKEFVLTELNILSHIFCFVRPGRKAVMRLLFSPIGYGLLWLNHFRRVFRDWRRNSVAKAKRKLGGSSPSAKSSL